MTPIEKITKSVYNKIMSNITIQKSNINGTFEAPLIGNYSGDYSFAGAFLARAALDSSVVCENLSASSQQNGIVVLDIIKKFGATVKRSGDTVQVQANKLKGTVIDISEFSQIAPMIALLSMFATGKTRIKGFENCGELQSLIIKNLRLLNVRCEYNSGDLWIWPQKSPDHAVLFANNHPYMALALILISTYTKDSTVIRDVDGLFKRYPDFLKVFEKLGGRYTLSDTLTL